MAPSSRSSSPTPPLTLLFLRFPSMISAMRPCMIPPPAPCDIPIFIRFTILLFFKIVTTCKFNFFDINYDYIHKPENILK